MSHEAFLREICEHPDDDAPRLIYADWLEENGQPERAEFIRVQIQLEQFPPGSVPQEVRERIGRLLTGRLAAWCAELPRLSGVSWGGFSRGFMSRVSVERYKHYHQHED